MGTINKTICNIKKSAFTLVEMSVVVVIIAVMLASIIVSKALITSAKVNRVQQNYRDFQSIYTIFRNTFDCIPGDCSIKALPQNIINGTPSGCFNLSTTTGMGNSGATQLTGTDAIITSFNSGMIDQVAKRTCGFFELQTFEPSAFGGPNTNRTAQNFSFINIANAIGSGLLNIGLSNPVILAYFEAQTLIIQNNIALAQNDINLTNNQIQAVQNQKNSLSYPVKNSNFQSAWSNCANSGGGNCCGSCSASSPQNIICNGRSCALLQNSINGGCAGDCQFLINYRNDQQNAVNLYYDTIDGYNNQLNNFNNILTTQQNTLNNTNLQLAVLNNTNNFLSLTIKTATQPSLPSSLKTQAMWDIRTVDSNGTSGFYPFELLDTTNLSRYKNQQVLIARDNSANDITINTAAMPALNAKISQKIDIKFDDGKPYTGNIIAGQSATNTTAGTSCTTTSLAAPISTAQWQASAVSTANYINTNSTNLANGCVLGWLII